MRIAVSHLTRMRHNHVCVAGMDVQTLAHIRPVLPFGHLDRRHLASSGGPFAIGAVVDLGKVHDVGEPPETEDREFDLIAARLVGTAVAASFWHALRTVAGQRLVEIFGDALRPEGNAGCAVDLGGVTASLGCLAPTEPPSLVIENQARLRLHLADTSFGRRVFDLSVTDLRLCEDDHTTIRVPAVRYVQSHLRRGTKAILSLGLTRPFSRYSGDRERHWLQVNNIHLAAHPTWDGTLRD